MILFQDFQNDFIQRSFRHMVDLVLVAPVFYFAIFYYIQHYNFLWLSERKYLNNFILIGKVQ